MRRLYIGEATAAPEGWDHLRTVQRIEMETLDPAGTRTNIENRYFVSSLPPSRLTDAQWLLLVRRHWGVETSHQILDVAFEEDAHPWIEQHRARGAGEAGVREVPSTAGAAEERRASPRDRRHGAAPDRVHAARTVARRDVAQRRATPPAWRKVMRDVELAVIKATAGQLAGLRHHRLTPAPA